MAPYARNAPAIPCSNKLSDSSVNALPCYQYSVDTSQVQRRLSSDMEASCTHSSASVGECPYRPQTSQTFGGSYVSFSDYTPQSSTGSEGSLSDYGSEAPLTISCKRVKETSIFGSSDEICASRTLSTDELKDRMTSALWSMFAADALAMPVHWYYNRALMQQQYGVVTDYMDPQPFHPDSFLHSCNPDGAEPLSDTTFLQRRNTEGYNCDIVGNVILHNKRNYWGVQGMHYHQSLTKGENTLNAQCARLLMQVIGESGSYDSSDFLESYVDFMVTPGTHNDTFAEAFHRGFFKNFSKGLSVNDCAGPETFDTSSIGALVMLPIIAFAYHYDVDMAKQRAVEHVRLTHRSTQVEQAAEVVVEAIINVLYGADLREECDKACVVSTGVSLKPMWDRGLSDVKVVDQIGVMCHLTASLPATLYLAGSNNQSLERALLTNANIGGSSCHRGTLLGAMVGAHLGTRAVPRRFVAGLKERKGLADDIEKFVNTVLAVQSAPKAEPMKH